MQFLGFINRRLMIKHVPIKTGSCYHASSAHTKKYCPQDTLSTNQSFDETITC